MKALLTILVITFISGCGRGQVDMDMARQDYVCAGHGGVYEYRLYLRSLKVPCVDGSSQRWKEVVLGDETYWPNPKKVVK